MPTAPPTGEEPTDGRFWHRLSCSADCPKSILCETDCCSCSEKSGNIIAYQDAQGMWHQLLDKPDSYPETSCTAMFVAAIAHGVNKGWLDSSFASVALQGWKAVCSQITPEGQVKNVCMGTGISRDLPFYYNRPAPLNDAHGLGAVVQAGIEINNVTTKTTE